MQQRRQLVIWLTRGLWVVLALLGGTAFGDALDGRSTAVVALSTAGLWAAWLAGLIALLVPRTSALTAVRVLVPAAVPATVWAALAVDEASPAAVAAVVVAALATAAALSPWVADAYIQGTAYGPERRLALRTPPIFLLLAPVTWAVVVAGAVTGPLLLATGAWWAVVLLAAGWAAAYFGVKSLHQLARRWVVLVPTGLVLHDPISMPEPQLFLRTGIAHVGPALIEAEDEDVVEDLTAGAAGLALELAVSEPVELLVRTGRGTTATREVDRVLFTPVDPTEVLAEAAERRIPVA